MPATPLALFIALALVPGYVYLQLSQRFRVPTAKSALAEVLELVTMGLVTTGVALLAFGLRFPAWLGRTLQTLNSSPADLSSNEITSAARFNLALVLSATLIALMLAGLTILIRKRTYSPSVMHATLGLDRKGYGRHVGILLKDGTTVHGVLHAYSMSDSDADRAVALKGPLRWERAEKKIALPFDYYVATGEQIAGLTMKHVSDPAGTKLKPRIDFRLLFGLVLVAIVVVLANLN